MTLEFILLIVYAFIFGIVIGSFLNVCIYRIPKKENIVTVGSHCMKCNHRLKWYDLVPLFSFIFLRGKCRYCGTKLSFQYPLVEFVNGALYVLVFWINGFSVESVLWALLTSCLIVISVIDYNTLRIPTVFELIILLIGVIHLFLDFENWLVYVIGFFTASLLLLIIALVFRAITGKSGLGLGDIELMACAGLCLGAYNIFIAMLIGSVLGAIVESIRLGITKKKGKFAFGPYLSIGIWIALMFGNELFGWYTQLF